MHGITERGADGSSSSSSRARPGVLEVAASLGYPAVYASASAPLRCHQQPGGAPTPPAPPPAPSPVAARAMLPAPSPRGGPNVCGAASAQVRMSAPQQPFAQGADGASCAAPLQEIRSGRREQSPAAQHRRGGFQMHPHPSSQAEGGAPPWNAVDAAVAAIVAEATAEISRQTRAELATVKAELDVVRAGMSCASSVSDEQRCGEPRWLLQRFCEVNAEIEQVQLRFEKKFAELQASFRAHKLQVSTDQAVVVKTALAGVEQAAQEVVARMLGDRRMIEAGCGARSASLMLSASAAPAGPAAPPTASEPRPSEAPPGPDGRCADAGAGRTASSDVQRLERQLQDDAARNRREFESLKAVVYSLAPRNGNGKPSQPLRASLMTDLEVVLSETASTAVDFAASVATPLPQRRGEFASNLAVSEGQVSSLVVRMEKLEDSFQSTVRQSPASAKSLDVRDKELGELNALVGGHDRQLKEHWSLLLQAAKDLEAEAGQRRHDIQQLYDHIKQTEPDVDCHAVMQRLRVLAKRAKIPAPSKTDSSTPSAQEMPQHLHVKCHTHPLVAFNDGSSNWCCDDRWASKCTRKTEGHSVRYSCRICDYDMCRGCALAWKKEESLSSRLPPGGLSREAQYAGDPDNSPELWLHSHHGKADLDAEAEGSNPGLLSWLFSSIPEASDEEDQADQEPARW